MSAPAAATQHKGGGNERQQQAAAEEELLEGTGSMADVGRHKTSIADVKTAVHTVLYKMVENSWPATTWPAIVLWLFDLLQMLVLPLSMDAVMPWREQSLILGLHSFLSPVALMPQRADAPHPPAAALYLFIIFAVFVVLLVTLFVFAVSDELGAIIALASSSARPLPRPRWRFTLLRFGTRTLLAGFMVPLFTALIAPFSCATKATWFDSGLTCFTSGHAGLVVAAVIVLPFALTYFLLTAACLVDRTPDPAGKKNALAAPHGRVEAAALVLKIAVAILYAFTPVSNPWAPAICSVVVSLAWLYLFVTYMPYFNMTLNRIQAALAGVHLAAGVAAVLSLALSDREHNAGAYVFFFLLAPAAYGAQAMLVFRRAGLRKAGDTSSAYAMELRVRLLLEEADSRGTVGLTQMTGGGGSAYAVPGFGSSKSAGLTGLGTDSDSDSESGDDSRALVKVAGSGSGRPPSAGTTRSGTIVGSRHGGSVAGSQRSGAASGTGGPAAASKEERKALIRKYLARGTETTAADYSSFPKQADTSRIRRVVNDLWLQALEAFSNSAMCELLAAHWFGVVCENPHLERIHLNAALAKADSAALDIHFFVAARRMALKDAEDARNKNAMTVERRMLVERMMSACSAHVQQCRQLVLSFWSLLSEKSPDLFRLQGLGVQISEAMDKTHGSFQLLLEMSSESAPVMRAYADFLLEVANDPRKAMDLLTDAEQIEDEQTRALSQRTELDIVFGRLSSFDISSDSLALLKVAADVDNIGTVTEANSAALKLFGYNRREFVGKDIAAIVPEPWQSVHHLFLARYCEDGKEHIVNSSRIYIALHRAGHVFPMRVNIRPTGNDWSAVAEEVPTSQSLVIFTGAEMNWKITAVCKSAQTGLGVDIQAMRAGILSIRTFLPSIEDSVAHLLLHREGGVVTLRNVVADILGDRAADRNAPPSTSAVVKAKLQVVRAPGVPSPVFIMRFRRATTVERETAGLQKKAAEGPATAAKTDGRRVVMAGASDEDDEDGAGSYRSDEAAGSGSEEEDAPGAARRGSSAARRPHFEVVPALQAPPMRPAPSPKRPALQAPPSPAREAEEAAATGVASSSPTSPELLQNLIAAAMEDAVCPVTGRSGQMPAGHVATAGSREPSRPPSAGNEQPGSRRGSDAGGAGSGLAVAAKAAAASAEGGTSSNTAGANGSSSLRQRRTTTGSTSSARVAPEAAPAPTSSKGGKGGFSAGATSKGGAVQALGGPVKTTSRRPSRTEEAGALVPATPLLSMPSSRSAGGHDRQRTATGEDNRSALGGGDGKRSHASGGQSSFTSATSATEILRKGVALRAATFEPSLLTLRRTILLVFVVATVLNVASLAICLGLLKQLQANMDLVALNGQRGVSLQRSYGGVQDLAILGAGLPFNRTKERIMAHLTQDLADFETIHQNLYLQVDGQLASEVRLYTVPTINVTDLVPGTFTSLSNYSSTSRLINLMNGGLEFVSKVRHVANAPDISDVNYEDTDTFWVLVNGYVPLRNAFNQSMLLANDRSAAQADTISMTNLIVLAAAFGVFAIVALGVMVPAVYKVHASKQSVMDTFLHVPVPVIRALRSVAFAKLAALRRAAEEEDAGMDLARDADFDGDELVNFGADLEAEGPPAGGGAGGRDSVPGGHGSMPSRSMSTKNFGNASAQLTKAINEMVARERATEAAGATATTRRRFRKAASDRLGVLARMLWPVILFMSYYVASYFYREHAVEYARYAKSEVLWSRQSEFYVSQLTFNLRIALAQCDLPTIKYQHARSSNAIRVINNYVDGLMYGDEARELRAGLQVSPNTFSLFMQDGCVENNGWYYDLAECRETFFDQLVAHGLLGAFKVYIQMVETLMERRIASVEAGVCSSNDLSTPEAVIVQRLGDEFLAVGFEQASVIRMDEQVAYFDSFQTTDILVTVASLLVLIVYYFGVYAPMLRRLDRDIKQARSLLLLFPDEVSRSAPAIIDAGRDMLRLDAGSSSRSSA